MPFPIAQVFTVTNTTPFLVETKGESWKSTWQVSPDLFVALGTIFLALVTGYLAWKTRDLAQSTADEVRDNNTMISAAQRQADAARDTLIEARKQTVIAGRTLNAQMRPAILKGTRNMTIGRSPSRNGEPFEPVEQWLVSLPLHNRGPGLARVIRVDFEIPGVGDSIALGQNPLTGPTVELTLAEDDQSMLPIPVISTNAAFEPLTTVIEADKPFKAVVQYLSLSGEEMQTLFSIEPGGGGWIVTSDIVQLTANVKPQDPAESA